MGQFARIQKVYGSFKGLLCPDSLYEEEDELEEEGEDGASYLEPPRLGAPETNNNLLLSPGSPAATTALPADKTIPQDLQQADSSTERDPNDSEGEIIKVEDLGDRKYIYVLFLF